MGFMSSKASKDLSWNFEFGPSGSGNHPLSRCNLNANLCVMRS